MRTVFYLLPMLVLLQACTNLSSAAVDMVQQVYERGNRDGLQNAPLGNFTYLEVHAPNSTALLVLGEVDQPQAQLASPVETWVSANNEILRTQGGFVVGWAGAGPMWQQARVVRAANGSPQQLVVDAPSLGLHSTPLNLQPVDFVHTKVTETQLMKRARAVPGLVERAWVGQPVTVASVAEPKPAVAPAPNLKPLQGVFQMVATHPVTGRLIYGQHCSTTTHCIEFLVRSPSQNL